MPDKQFTEIRQAFDDLKMRFADQDEKFDARFQHLEDRLVVKIWQTVFTVNMAMFGLIGLALLLFKTFLT